MSIKFVLASIILLGISLTTFTSCSDNCSGDSCVAEGPVDTLEAIIHDENMNEKLHTITTSDPLNVISLSLNSTYMLEVYVNDDKFNSNPNYVLSDLVFTLYDESSMNPSIIDLQKEEDMKITNHLFYRFKGVQKINDATMLMTTDRIGDYGWMDLFVYLSFS